MKMEWGPVKRGEMVKGGRSYILSRGILFFCVCVCVCCCNIMKEKREPFDVRFHHPTSSHSSYITYRGYRTMKHNLF